MLIVLRHGRTEANRAGELLGRRDPSLDAIGRAQAAAAAAVLPAGARVISSPLARCRETAAALDPLHEVDERLIELNYGDLEGTRVADVPRAMWDAWRANDDWKPPAGESHNELAARVWTLPSCTQPCCMGLPPRWLHYPVCLFGSTTLTTPAKAFNRLSA